MKVLLSVALLVAVFLLGAWWGSHDRLCVTAPSPVGDVVWCSQGDPGVEW